MKRAAAGETVAKMGGADERPAVRKLLNDSDSGVRRRVALALAEVRDKSGVPTLIELLQKGRADDAAAAEDALYAMAGEKAPATPTEDTDTVRQTYFKAWADWWTKEGEKLDLKKVDLAGQRDYTLVIALDNRGANNGYVEETDAAGKQRWRIDNLRFPVFASGRAERPRLGL